jgi:hypothetical protein
MNERPAALPRPLLWALAGGLLLSTWLLFGFDPLPISDLPQHAAQVALFAALGDPSFPFAGQYELNFFTPYLLAYLIAGALTLAMPVPLAFKATLYLALLAWLWAYFRFLRRTGATPWWLLVVFPVFFGMSFLWGFVNYLLAVPLVLLAVELSFVHGAAPDRRTAMKLGLVGVACFFAHGPACVFGMGLGGAVALLRHGRRAGAVRLLLPYLPAALLAVAWWLLQPAHPFAVSRDPFLRQLGIFRRLLGGESDFEAGAWSLALLLLMLSGLAAGWRVLREQPAREAWARRLPLLAVLVYVVAMPDNFGSFYWAAGRFVLFVPLFAGWWLGPKAWRLSPQLISVLVLGWLVVLAARFGQAERELAPPRQLVASLPERGTLLSIRLDSDRNDFGIPLAIHQAAWYTVYRQGQADFSFASFDNVLVRYKADRRPLVPAGFEHAPWRFDVMKVAGDYFDFWLVYAPPGASANLPPERFRLRERIGAWWLYETLRAP